MNIDLVEVKDKLNKLAVSLKRQKADKHIAKMFKETTFIYVYFLIIQKTSQEDLAGDYFINRIDSKLDDLFDKYDENKGEFSKFLSSFIFRSFEFYKKVITKKRENSIEVLLKKTGNKLLDFGDENEDEDKELSKRFDAELYKNIKITNTMQNAFIVFSLKQCSKISKEGIKNICYIFKINKQYMKNIINQGIDLINKNLEKINFHQERKSYYYINNLEIAEKIRELKKLMQTVSDNSEEKKIEKEILELNNRYNKNKKVLNSHKEKIRKLSELSYKDIADILQIEYKKIRGLYYIAKKELIRLNKEMKIN